MQNVGTRGVGSEVAVIAEPGDVFPALQYRKQRTLAPGVERTRRELWRAFQRGSLSEEEFTRTLDRLEFDGHLT